MKEESTLREKLIDSILKGCNNQNTNQLNFLNTLSIAELQAMSDETITLDDLVDDWKDPLDEEYLP